MVADATRRKRDRDAAGVKGAAGKMGGSRWKSFARPGTGGLPQPERLMGHWKRPKTLGHNVGRGSDLPCDQKVQDGSTRLHFAKTALRQQGVRGNEGGKDEGNGEMLQRISGDI